MDGSKGFTLIELAITIIILSVLVAFAVPKYVELNTNARISAVNKLKGVIGDTATMTRVTAKIRGVDNGIVVVDSSTDAQVSVDNVTYYPLASSQIGIVEALESYDGFTPTGDNPVIFELDSAPDPATCAVTYSLSLDNEQDQSGSIETIIASDSRSHKHPKPTPPPPVPVPVPAPVYNGAPIIQVITSGC